MSRIGAPRRVSEGLIVVIVLSLGAWVVPATAWAQGSGSTDVRPGALAPGSPPAGATDLGALPGTQELQVGVVMPPSNSGQLQALLQGLYDPSSPDYHQWLKPGQFMEEFGPSAADVSAVESWLDGAGLSAKQSGFTVNVSAPASQVSSVLGTSFERYRNPSGTTGYLAQQTPLVPSTLASGTITAILGLNTVAQFVPENTLTPQSLGAGVTSPQPDVDGVTPCAAAETAAAPGYYTLDAEGAAYGMGSLLSDNQKGQGETIGLYELAPHLATDVATYDSCFGLTNPLTTVPVDGGGGTAGGDGTLEADSDIEQVSTQAPDASIISYEGPNDTATGAFDTWNAIVSADAAQVVSTSWGLCEPLSESAGYISSFSTLFEQAALQGQTILAASGDSGSEDCYGSDKSTTLEVDYPASDPNVTAVGGTSLFGPGDEVVWNASGDAGGGGISRYVADPSWQPVDLSWTSTGNACGEDCREVPDISSNAGVGMIVSANGAWTAVGGTSLAAPLLAGLVADRNDGCASTTADFAPTLYGAASHGLYGSGLTDITSGDNDATGTYGGVDYAATTGYDPASGLGSPLAAGLSCPEITSVSPGSSGAQVTVSGLGLENATIIFGTTSAQVLSSSATSATVVVPSGSGTVAVRATSALGDGTQTTSFTYGASSSPPTVTGVSPASGPSTGGTPVVITGTNFTGATGVKFGTTAATTFSVTGATSISATAPAGSGTVDVTVTTPGGTSATGSVDHYTYNASTAATISAVGTLVDKSGDDTTTLAVTPAHDGDLLVLVVKVSSSTITVSSVTGGGASTWARAEGPYTGYSGNDLEIWTGVVSATGSSTITVAFSGAVTSIYIGLAAQEFSASSGTSTVWGVDNGGGISNASSTTVTLPKLTPSGTGELYFGYGAVAETGSAGTTSGFTYATTSDGDVDAYDTSVSAATQPTAKQSPAGVSGAVAVLITASGSAPSPPTVTGVSPASGPSTGGTPVVITGTNFTGATGVKFGTTAATTFSVTGATSISATAPAGSGTVDVTVTTPGGTSATGSADEFTYVTPSPPTVTGVSPASGPSTGGTPVVITGTNFTGATGVKFGTTAATTFSVTGATSISATAPAGSGTVDVTVTTPGGTSATGSADEFTYVTPSPPTVTGVSPASGPSTGGTPVVITGTNFTGATGVKFGTTAATTFSVTGATSISATAPAGSGTVDVTVTTPGGTSATGSADEFTYVTPSPPTVTGVSPASGPSTGGTPVVITGTNFTGATGVKFGTTAATTFSVTGATSISATAPAGSGTVDVTVTTPGGTSATGSVDHYTYNASTAATISAVGTLVDKSGDDTTTLAVTPAHDGDLLVLVVKVSSSTITVSSVTGGGASTWARAEGPYTGYSGNDLEIWTGVVSATGSSTITVAFSGAVTSIYIGLAAQEFSASSGTSTVWGVDNGGGISNASSTTVTLPKLTPSGTGELYFGYGAVAETGSAGTTSGFTYATTSDGDVDAYDTSVSAATQPTAKQSPAGVSGAVAVLITASGSAPSPPTVTGVSPASGPSTGGTPVVITGTNFTGATGVKFGTTAATTFSVTGATSISATAPAGSGTVDVTVTTPGGTSATGSADEFTYVTPSPPTVTGVSPASGPSTGGTPVVITGTNFTGATGVKFGTTAATTFSVTGATSISATAPAGSGTVDVTVTTPGGTSATGSADEFTYVTPSPPTVTGVSPASGPSTGGTPVVITGTNFTGATGVKFGTTAATTFSVTGATSISATAPAGSGTVDVTVTTPGGTSATGSVDHYTYNASTAATISAVGTLVDKSGDDTTTLAVTPAHDGDLLVLVVKVSSSTITVSSVTGGGASTWARAEGPYTGYSGNDLEIWTGVVSATGSSTITVAFSGAVTSIYIGLAAQEFSASSGTSTVWGVDNGGGISNASSTTVTLPKLTPSGTGELYFGYGAVAETGSAGTTSGFTYATTSDGDVDAYDTSVSAATQPTAKQSPAGVSGAVAVLITATA